MEAVSKNEDITLNYGDLIYIWNRSVKTLVLGLRVSCSTTELRYTKNFS